MNPLLTPMYPINPNNVTESRKDRKFFTAKEDEVLKMIVWKYGARNWTMISSMLPGKTARQCRDRYMNYLAPGITHEEWTKEEDELLKKLYDEHGPKWSLISKQFPNRSSINIKNRWAHFLGKKMSSLRSSSSDSDQNSDYSSEISTPFPSIQGIQSIDIDSFLATISSKPILGTHNFQMPQLKAQVVNTTPNKIIFPSLIETRSLIPNHSTALYI